MINITVEYWGQLKLAASVRSENVEVEETSSLRDLIELLASRHGEPLRGLLLDGDGKPRVTNVVSIGERMVQWNAPPRLKDGDVVAILSPISGG